MLLKLTDIDGDAILFNIDEIVAVTECYKVENKDRFRKNTRVVHMTHGRMEVKETIEEIQEMSNSLEMLCYGESED